MEGSSPQRVTHVAIMRELHHLHRHLHDCARYLAGDDAARWPWMSLERRHKFAKARQVKRVAALWTASGAAGNLLLAACRKAFAEIGGGYPTAHALYEYCRKPRIRNALKEYGETGAAEGVSSDPGNRRFL